MSSRAFRGGTALTTLNFGRLASIPEREYVRVVGSQPVSGRLLRWPQEEPWALQSGAWGLNPTHQLAMLDTSLGPFVPRLEDGMTMMLTAVCVKIELMHEK